MSRLAARAVPNERESARPDGRHEIVLDVRDLTGPADHAVLRDVSIAVPRGATHVVLGAIHAGKSLLLRLILGLERAKRGTVAIDGEAFDAARPDDAAVRRARRHVGVVFDSSALVSRLSLLENVELPLVEHTDMSANDARDACAELMRQVGLAGGIERTPDTVSRLDLRRAAIARAVVLQPAMLLIDEPGHGLDSHGASELDDTLDGLQERYGFAMLICSQEVRYAVRPGVTISVLADGAIVESGDIDRLRRSPHTEVRRLIDRRGAA